MECFVQYLDDLEDLYYAVALIWERIRTRVRFAVFVIASLALQVFGVFIALNSPPIAVAIASLLLVALLYRGAVSPITSHPAHA
ncbi:MAG: hypothetical protein OEV34_07905 [Gammaproteobacteria bacterium]|jgi:uncharacterized membrane protein|nr:hypothetical protein [Gammaproteobacteria bacterium]